MIKYWMLRPASHQQQTSQRGRWNSASQLWERRRETSTSINSRPSRLAILPPFFGFGCRPHPAGTASGATRQAPLGPCKSPVKLRRSRRPSGEPDQLSGVRRLTRGDATYPRMYPPTITQVERTKQVTSPGQLLPCPDTEGAHGERRYPPRLGPGRHRVSRTGTGMGVWVAQFPRLARAGDFQSLRDWLAAARPAEADDVLHALAISGHRRVATTSRPASVLAWALLPGACALAHRLYGLSPRIDEVVAAQLWLEIRSFPWHRLHKVAGNILANTRAVLRECGVRSQLERTDRAWSSTHWSIHPPASGLDTLTGWTPCRRPARNCLSCWSSRACKRHHGCGQKAAAVGGGRRPVRHHPHQPRQRRTDEQCRLRPGGDPADLSPITVRRRPPHHRRLGSRRRPAGRRLIHDRQGHALPSGSR